MLEIAALLSSGGSDDSREEALSLAGRLVFEALPVDDGPVAVKGLVVSEIFKYLTEIQTAQALVQIWAEGTDDEAVVLDHVLPVKERGDVSVDAWVVRELVFRQPLERESIGASPNGVKLAGTATSETTSPWRPSSTTGRTSTPTSQGKSPASAATSCRGSVRN
jgi:hypothetical protein